MRSRRLLACLGHVEDQALLAYETNFASSICPGQNGTSSFADGRRRDDRLLGGVGFGSAVDGAGFVFGGRLLALGVRGFFSI